MHRQLHKIGRSDIGRQPLIHHAQREGMHHILGILQQHAGKAATRAGLVGGEGEVEAVEAIGLGGGAEAIVDHQPHPCVGPGGGHGGGDGGGIVAIAANVEAIIALRPGAEHMGDSGADHGIFVPGGDQHRHRAHKGDRDGASRKSWRAGTARDTQAQPDHIQRHFINHADDKPEQREKQKLALNQL